MVTIMRAKKIFCVVAYDVSDDRRRSHVVKILQKVGVRVNFSVFECMITDAQYEKLQKKILSSINIKEDKVVYYPICVKCFTQIVYQPDILKKYSRVVVV